MENYHDQELAGLWITLLGHPKQERLYRWRGGEYLLNVFEKVSTYLGKILASLKIILSKWAFVRALPLLISDEIRSHQAVKPCRRDSCATDKFCSTCPKSCAATCKDLPLDDSMRDLKASSLKFREPACPLI